MLQINLEMTKKKNYNILFVLIEKKCINKSKRKKNCKSDIKMANENVKKKKKNKYEAKDEMKNAERHKI